MTHADTLEVALRLLARSRRVLDYMADEIHNGRALSRNDASIAEDLAGEIVALIGHSVTDQPESPEMFALRELLDEMAEHGGRADLESGWWYMRLDETPEQHAARLKADPRWRQLRN